MHPTRGSGGNFFIVDMCNNMVRKVNTSGVISRFAGNLPPVGYSGDGGPATSTKFFTPFGVAVDGSGNVYIADNNNYRIRKVNTSGIIKPSQGMVQRDTAGTADQRPMPTL